MKTRAGDRDVQHLIEGDRDELLIRAGLMTVQPDRSAPDYNAEIASLRRKRRSARQAG